MGSLQVFGVSSLQMTTAVQSSGNLNDQLAVLV